MPNPARSMPSGIDRYTDTPLRPASLSDIAHIPVNTALPVPERLRRFVADGGDPYVFRVGDTIVRVRYGTPHVSLQERLLRLASE